jgi:F0F1-type ATP synthase membrane subunit b/b'
MKETLKKIWEKIKWVVGLIAAGFVMALFVFKRPSVQETVDDASKEREAKDEALRRYAEEKEKLEKQRQDALRAEETERQKLLDTAERLAREEERRLKELVRRDEDRFKEELNRQLGVTEKRKDPPD